ncbi:MAG: hypothetical protein J6S09_00650 [Paludibacteraceae bacterium]|nr:hypothetical protein [Paludibacteraceae bacterium]
MKKFYSTLFVMLLLLIANSSQIVAQQIVAQQLPNPSFEDWSGEKFDGEIQPKDWYGSNISQAGINFNLTNREAGHTGSYSIMVKDTEVGALGITELSPGYFSLGRPWSWIKGLDTGTATAGTSGGIKWTHRPDTMSVWIKRVGPNVDKEDFYLLYYAWTGTAKGDSYKAKNGGCSSVSQTNEESDIRIALDANECGTVQQANQIAEGMWREMKQYGDWTNIRVPIYYFNDDVPEMMNIIFSASNYPNFRAKDGLYENSALYVDDVELIYSSKIDKLYIRDREWKAFDPNSAEEQVYSVGKATEIPAVFGVRGVGTITNARGDKATFSGRKLTNEEFQILQQGAIDGDPMIIQVHAADSSSTTTYKIKFVSAASNNARLADIQVNGSNINGFNAYLNTYNVQLPYGTTEVPVVTATAQDAGATVTITQPTSTTGTATIHVAAADGTTTNTYTLHFSVAELSDNTLQAIYIDGKLVPAFSPTKNNYTISLPLGTTTTPTITWQSAYADGAQTITLTKNTLDEGAQITVSAPAAQNTRTYKLTYKIEASSYAYLAGISLNGQPIDGFSPEQTNYAITLPIGTTTLPVITWTQGDPYQTVTITEGGVDGTTRIVVTAAAGNSVTYRLNFSTEKSTNNALQAIALDDKPLEGFHHDTLNYTITLPAGTTTLPVVTYTQSDEYQTVTTNTNATTRTVRIVVKAGDGSSRVYTLTFEVEKSANALLKMIYLDGDSLADFNPERLSYIVPLEQEQIPDITVGQSPDQNVNITQPNSFGTARIMVQPEVGTPIEYTIIFTSSSEPAIPEFAADSFPLSNDVSLAAIYVNGELYQANPAPQTYTYELPWRTAQVPSVVPVANSLGQTITMSSPGLNQTTTIHVVAEDGITTADYAIAFPVAKSSNTQLELIDIDGITFDYDPTVREYAISLPYQTKELPAITFTKAEAEQTVELCTAGLSAPATLYVTAEDGTVAKYTFTFQVAYAPYDNTLLSIVVENIGALDLSAGAEHTVTLPYGTTELLFSIVKQYPEQQVVILNGGVSSPTTITVKADDPAKADKVYTITPQLMTYPDYSLTGIKVDGVELPNFDPNTFTYILPVTKKPKLEYLHAADVDTIVLQDNNKFTQVEVTDQVNARIYTFYYYYQNDIIPNGDFTEYRTGMKNTKHTQMPVGWYGYADKYDKYTAFTWTVTDPGKEIFKTKDGNLGISWGYWSALKGSAPLVLTLGSTDGFKYKENGGSSASFSGGIPFRNTPDAVDITSQLVDDEGLKSKFSFVFTDEQNSVETVDYIVSNVTTGFITHRQPLANAGKVIKQLNINIDASNGYLAGVDVAGTFTNYINYGDVIYIDRIAFVYSSALTAITVNGVPATRNGNEFTVALEDSEVELPTLAFTGEVPDQQQVVSWADGWTIDGATATRTATITNYAEDGSSTVYTLTVTRPASNNTSCTYTLEGENLTVVKASHYQTITVEREATRYVITVQAEDGTAATYYAEVPTLSIDADPYCETTAAEPFQYAPSSATLEGVMEENDMLIYETTSPLDTVVIVLTDTAYHLDVFGAVGSNHYCVSRQASNNALLSAILINGAPLADFYESTFIYQFTAPELPELTATAAEPNALVQTALLRQDDNHYVYFIQVTAPDGYTKQDYIVAITIHTLRSTALLNNILANNVGINGFLPTIFTYGIQLPAGSSMPTFKAITADGATATASTAQEGRYTTITYEVISEDGKQDNTYYVVVEKLASDICTLDAIYLDGLPLEGFSADTYAYDIKLPHGTTQLPEVTATTTDPAATHQIVVDEARKIVSITVTAENNAHKTYTIYFTIAKNTDATLSGIFADGELLANFDALAFDYTLDIPFGAPLPVITATATDAKAQVAINALDAMHHTIVVTAEDGLTTLTYIVTFVQLPSTNSNLLNIFISGDPLEGFTPTDYEYAITLPYGAPLPEVTWLVADAEQVVEAAWEGQTFRLTVTAGDKATVSEYTIVFTHELSDNNYLLSIALRGEQLATFHRDSLAYTVTYPVGTDSTALITAAEVVAIPEDASATVAVQEQGTTLVIIVTAANGNIRAYSIEQLIELSNEARLSMIYLDSVAIEGFDPDIYEYTIKLPQGGILPFVTATPIDTLYAEWERGMEQTLEDGSKFIEIDGIAQDGTILTYSVHFIFADWSPTADAVVGDCLFFPVQGAYNTFRAVTISLGVKCAIYTLSGQLITIMDVPVLDVNSVEVEHNENGEQVIKEGSVPNDAIGADYVARSGEPFVYMFYNVNTKRIGRGGKYVTH